MERVSKQPGYYQCLEDRFLRAETIFSIRPWYQLIKRNAIMTIFVMNKTVQTLFVRCRTYYDNMEITGLKLSNVLRRG